jgi:UDP-N-acetylmuramyl tripeptide synthase
MQLAELTGAASSPDRDPVASAFRRKGSPVDAGPRPARSRRRAPPGERCRDVQRSATEWQGREVLDGTAGRPESFRATFETAEQIPHRRIAAVYAIRGNRGVDLNRRSAAALADLAHLHGIDPLVLTTYAGETGPQDVVSDEERDAALEAVSSRGRGCVVEPRLDLALRTALEATAPGDLILLLGAQGMDRGRERLSSGRTSS